MHATAGLTTVPIGDVHTEAGAVIEDAHLAYQAWGEYTGDNVVLVEHALTGDTNISDWWPGLIGPGRALDTDKYFIICANALGGCSGSTGPASLHPDGKRWGSRFPAISIRDQVTAERTLLDILGIKNVHTVIGGSMGGARTLEWALSYPNFMDAVLVIAVSARASAWQIGIQSAQISAVEQDLHWNNGDYYESTRPLEGLASARRLAHLTYRGELEIDERFGTQPQPGENPLGPFRDPNQRFQIQGYLDYHGKKLSERFDAGCYVALTEALNRHDIGRGRGGLNRALGSCYVPTMVAGVDTDILYPYHQQEHLTRNLGNLLGMAKISSPMGHDGFLTEIRQMDRIIRHFFQLAEGTKDAGIEYYL